MAKFSKWNQPNNRRGGRPLDLNSKAGQKRAEQARKEQEREKTAFAEFENAEGGSYNGFSFANAFHAAYSKSDAPRISDNLKSRLFSILTAFNIAIDYLVEQTAKRQ